MASSDGDDYPAYARWLWNNADPLLERLFETSLLAAELAVALPILNSRLERPVSASLGW